MSTPPIPGTNAYHGAAMQAGGRRPTLVAVAFVAVLGATASCRQILGIGDPPRPPDPPRPCGDPLVIDDMEDGDLFICNSGGREGAWFNFGDGSPGAELHPGEPFIPSEITDGKRDASRWAAHFSGSGFSRWGAILGFNFNTDGFRRSPYNAAAASALKFWMKSNAPVEVGVQLPETTLVADGGDCVETPGQNNCNQHFHFDITAPANKWTEYIVPFSALRQPGSAQWNPAKLLGVQFLAPTNTAFDIWIDDIAFDYCATPECIPTCTDLKKPVACPKTDRRAAGCFPPEVSCAVIDTWCADPMLIDDMEDGDELICESGGRDGGWYTYAFEDQPVQFEHSLIPGGRGDSHRAAHLTASSLTGWGAGMGIGLKAYGRQLYDTSAVDGVTFWAKGNAPIFVQFRLAETTPTTNPPGTCTNPGDCDNHFLFRFPAPGDEWTEYRVPFTALRQRPGGSGPWNPAQLLALEFGVPAWDVDVWIDDIRFYTCEGSACVPTCVDPALPVACPASGSRRAFCWPAETDCANPPTLSYNTSVWGSGPDDVWIAGGTEIDYAGTISHWDGSGLSTVTVPSPGLWGVWGSGPDDVWTFGMGGTIRRRQGGVWSDVLSGVSVDLFQGAWGSAANDVWAAGAEGTIVHWNGMKWTKVPSQTTQDLWGVWGTSPNDVWAVGAGGTILRWNGSVWQPIPSGTTRHLDCVWASGPTDAWAVGDTVLRWNGLEWTIVPDVTNKFLESVWGTGPDDVWAAGAEGTILHWDGSGPWKPWSAGTTAYLNGIWGSGRHDVWVVGELGTVLRFDGSRWAAP